MVYDIGTLVRRGGSNFAEFFWGDFDPWQIHWFNEHMDLGQILGRPTLAFTTPSMCGISAGDHWLIAGAFKLSMFVECWYSGNAGLINKNPGQIDGHCDVQFIFPLSLHLTFNQEKRVQRNKWL